MTEVSVCFNFKADVIFSEELRTRPIQSKLTGVYQLTSCHTRQFYQVLSVTPPEVVLLPLENVTNKGLSPISMHEFGRFLSHFRVTAPVIQV